MLTKAFDTEAQAKAWVAAEEAGTARGEAPKPASKPIADLTVSEWFTRYAKKVPSEEGSARWEAIRLNALPLSFSNRSAGR